jgi:23S rRNA (adenine2030-N6)-methyltransferase
MIRDGADPALLNGAGLVVVNAPFTLAENLEMLLPELVEALQQGNGGGFRIEQLGTEALKGATNAR